MILNLEWQQQQHNNNNIKLIQCQVSVKYR